MISTNTNHIINKWNSFTFLFAICISCIVACKSAKDRNVAFDRVKEDKEGKHYNKWDNFTTKYNILYNANTMMQNEQEAIFNASGKNFQIRQSVFDEPQGDGEAHALMDSLVKKAYKIVNNKQESKYVNEAYLVLGKANYLKGGYHTSIEFFNHLRRTAKEEQPEFLSLAYAWKSRALLQIGKIEQSKLALDSAFSFLSDDSQTRTFVNACMANYLLRVGDELRAIPYLEYALESNSNSLDGKRWTFLLAQLYKDNGQSEKSYQFFSKIARSNVPYDMSFEAALQAAFLEGNASTTFEQKIKPLQKMLKEGKNDGYQDQILFQIGDIYYDNKDEKTALTYFNRSLKEPKKNIYQTTETFLKLADHYFKNARYNKAQDYYDSVALVLPADYTDVNKLRRKLSFMEEITQLYQQVQWQDTVLTLAGLDSVAQENLIASYVNEQLEEYKVTLEQLNKNAKKKKKKTNLNSSSSSLNNSFFSNNTFSQTGNANDGKAFYFNNPDELMMGQSAFKRRWGNRQAKDNWRYEADNALVTQKATLTSALADTAKAELKFDENEFKERLALKYKSEIPQSKEEYDQAHKVIHDKLIVIGNIYRDYTKDNLDAIHVYEEFLKRYPNTEASAEIYYSLYRMYDPIDKTKSLNYKNKLISLHPNSLHAKVAHDPAYMDKIKRDKNILDRVFEKLFNLYAEGDHAKVISEADIDLKERFENTGLVAQVEYLRALAVGRVGRLEDFTVALNNIIDRYPQDSLVTPLAKENLTFIEQNPQMFTNRVNALQDADRQRVVFLDEPNMTHWPSLAIDGDYRSGIAIVKESPVKKEETKGTTKEKKEDVKVAEKKVEPKKEESKIIAEATKNEAKIETIIPVEQKKIEEVKKEEERKLANLTASESANNVSISGIKSPIGDLKTQDIKIGEVKIDFGPNDYRDKKLFPDTAVYYFTINVNDPTLNMAPSRYGLGQFNRTRYQNSTINHQLKVVNGENQLIFVGPFNTYDEVKIYESRISSLLVEIMKVPTETYNTFIITRESINLLTDGVEIMKYHQNYIEQ